MKTNVTVNPYKESDPRKMPAYTLAEASRYLRISPSTLRAWVKGRTYTYRDADFFSKQVISSSELQTPFLSFEQLVEGHIIRALRKMHRVSMQNLKTALGAAQEKFGINNLLLSPQLKTGAGQLFLDRYSELINLSKSGQYAMKRILEAHLERVEYDASKLPLRFYPFLSNDHIESRKVIVIDPLIAFGKPVVARRHISTCVIVDRIDAGEAIQDVADDYGLDLQDVNDAILYERAA